jgi:3-hydroxyacyl-[acyl-carrier-protein] dehydratase
MKFLLVDKIQSIEPGRRIVTIKALSLAEEYLADHFPSFPVLPGVLMLEAMTQSAAWLVHVELGFSRSIVVLSAARNVRYANFVQPGKTLRCEVEVVSISPETSKFRGVAYVVDSGTSEGRQAVTAKLELRSYNLAERHARLAKTDTEIVEQLRAQFALVGGPEALAVGGEGSPGR